MYLQHIFWSRNKKKYIKFGEILLLCSQDIEWKRNFGVDQRHNSSTNVGKNDLKQSQARSCQYECIKFGEIMSICSQDIVLKKKFGLDQGP